MFCEDCLAATTERSAGNLFAFDLLGRAFLGTTLMHPREQCPQCYSVIETRWLVLFFIPLIPMGSFRVYYGQRDTFDAGEKVRWPFISRKLKADQRS